MKTIAIGVMPPEQIRTRSTAVATGEYRQRTAQLKVIRGSNPDSIAVLARITDRRPGNLSRTHKAMSRDGRVDLKRKKTPVRPVVKASGFLRIRAQA